MNHRASGEEPSAEAYLFSYLRMLETGGEGLPPAFVTGLRRALAYYGVQTLDRSPALEESLLWICKSHQRVEQQIAPVLGVLERRLRRAEVLAPRAEESLRTLLDRMVSMTNGLFPAVTDLAREVRYRYFDQPLFERARQQVYQQVEEHLAYIAANPDAVDRHERAHALVECPQPLVGLLSSRFGSADLAMRKLMLEAITWRYYRIRTLENFRSFDRDGRCYASAEYDHEGKRIHVFTTHTEHSRLSEAMQATFPLIAEVPADHDIVIDFYTWHSGWLGDPDSTQQEVRSLLDHAGFPRSIRRVVVEVASPGHSQGVGGMQHFTFRPTSGNAYEEEKLYRGLHPMMGKRLHVWRLSNFKIDRLPSVEDIYLLHAVARDNPKDERLFACAEVRDVTPVRNQAGRVVQLPHLERMLTEAIAEHPAVSVAAACQSTPLLEPDIALCVASPLSGAGRVAGYCAQIGARNGRLGTGTGGSPGSHSQSGHRRTARYGSTHFESRAAGVCSSPSGPPINCSPSNRWPNMSRK